MSSIMGGTDMELLFKSNFDYATQVFLFCGVFLSIAVKTPVYPFNIWLLKAHVESPLGGSIILAGINVPALNLAKCWEHRIYVGSTSRKLFANYSSFYSTLRENDTLKLENIETIQNCESNIELNRIFRGHTLNTTIISSYLAGLIESDGCIYVSPNSKAVARVTITFNSKDLPLALLIQKELKCGNIYKRKGKNAYEYVISNLEGLILITNLINGYMRTHKIDKLYKLID